jgi:hypothetical protein
MFDFWSEVVEEDRSCAVLVSSNPLHIARPAGQVVSIKLLDFSPTDAAVAEGLTAAGDWTPRISSLSKQDTCVTRRLYGYIIDKSAGAINKKNVSICSGTGLQRMSTIYMSSSSSVELVLVNDDEHATNGKAANFLIGVEGM